MNHGFTEWKARRNNCFTYFDLCQTTGHCISSTQPWMEPSHLRSAAKLVLGQSTSSGIQATLKSKHQGKRNPIHFFQALSIFFNDNQPSLCEKMYHFSFECVKQLLLCPLLLLFYENAIIIALRLIQVEKESGGHLMQTSTHRRNKIDNKSILFFPFF